MEKNTDLRQLPLSHLFYLNSEIDINKANQFLVYHYPLINNYHWKEEKFWKDRIDSELDSRQFAYLMKKYGNQFGLYIALQNENDLPPCILDKNGEQIIPERVHYAPILNPVWIRLMMRSLRAFGTHCKGAYSLGCPLLKVDSWASGVNAISIDCRTQQLRDGDTTEIALFYTNVPLRPVSKEENINQIKKPLWIYDKKNILVRWYPHKEEKTKKVLYREIKKNKNSRKQRAFLDLSSPQKFTQSWPMILKPIQDEFIEFAENYGFNLKRKILNLEKMKLKTKYKNIKTKSVFQSVNISGEIKVLDLRVNKNVSSEQILDLYGKLMNDKGVNISWFILSEIDLDRIESLILDKNDRLLVLLDQEKGVEGDRYLLTKCLVGKFAIQHINVNPYDIIMDPIEKGLLIESQKEDDPIKLYIDIRGDYYNYNFDLFSSQDYLDSITRKLEVVVKDLELKSFLLNDEYKLSSILPLQTNCLNKSTLIITDGYLFTVDNDRPILIPFDPTDEDFTILVDEYLSAFNTSTFALLSLINEKWPYSYRQDVVMDYYGTSVDKQKKFAARITLVLNKLVNNQVSIMMQDPSYDKPHILPVGMDEVYSDLVKKQNTYEIKEWILPSVEILLKITKELYEEGIFTEQKFQRFSNELPELAELWQSQLIALIQKNEVKSTYNQIKKDVFEKWLERKNKKKDTIISGCWDTVLSRCFDKPLNDIKRWLSDIPGIQRLWFDKEQGYFIVGGLAPPKAQLMRQPSIRQWHTLQGALDIELLSDLLDVDWVRMNQLAGNPCAATLIKRWKEINNDINRALYVRKKHKNQIIDPC